MGKRLRKRGFNWASLLLAGLGLLLFLTNCSGCRNKKQGATGAQAAPRPPNALDKIAAAEKAGRLDLNTAWTYKLQALIDPASLPEEYRSPERIPCGNPTLKGLNAVRARLKPETLERLRPYLVRPTDPASVFAGRVAAKVARRRPPAAPGMLYAQDAKPPRPTGNLTLGNWIGVGCHKAPVTVWSPIGQEKAEEAAGLIDGNDMWAKFLKIMPDRPLSDQGAKNDGGNLDQGIDGDLDIYLVPGSEIEDDGLEDGSAKGSADGWCLTINSDAKTPTWIMVDQGLSGDELAATLAHELFHSFQCAIDSQDEIWWDESTATWAEEYIGPGWNTEQDYLIEAFDNVKFLLQTINDETGKHPYGAYIFPFYLAGRFDDAFIGKIWKACGAEGPNALEAVVGQLAGAGLELKEAWKEFALMNYNDTRPYGRQYKERLDTLPLHWEDRVVLTDRSQAQAVELPPLSAFYFDVENRGIDPEKFPALRFRLEELEKQPNVTVQAIITRRGNHRVEDWTGQKEHNFCLKNEAERFDDVVVVVASHEREETLQGLAVPIELGYLTECDADWVGTLAFRAAYSCGYETEGEWRKTGRWQAGVGAPWQDQFTKNDYKYEYFLQATATLQLALQSSAGQAGSEEEKELTEAMNQLFGGAVYSMKEVRGSCQVRYHTLVQETTAIRPPGEPPFVLTTITDAAGGGPVTKYNRSVLLGPRLTVYPEKGEYTLEFDIAPPGIPGTSVVKSSNGDYSSNPWTYEPELLFSSYNWRDNWAQPAFKGTYKDGLIQGTWKSPPRQKPSSTPCADISIDNADITITWSIRKIR